MQIIKTLAEKFGFRKNEQLTIDQALNIAHKEASRPESDLRAEAEKIEYTPSMMTREDQQKYLEYCLSLCSGHPEFVAILRLKIAMSLSPEFRGYSQFQKSVEISQQLKKFGIHKTFREVDKLELDALKFVQDQINKTKETCIPIL